MNKLVMYGSEKCPDCRTALVELDRKDIEYVFINITDSMSNLREFLDLRDNNDEFSQIKTNGSIGIPCYVKNNRITFSLDEILD